MLTRSRKTTSQVKKEEDEVRHEGEKGKRKVKHVQQQPLDDNRDMRVTRGNRSIKTTLEMHDVILPKKVNSRNVGKSSKAKSSDDEDTRGR